MQPLFLFPTKLNSQQMEYRNTLMVDVVGETFQRRRLMVVALFITLLVKAACRFILPNTKS